MPRIEVRDHRNRLDTPLRRPGQQCYSEERKNIRHFAVNVSRRCLPSFVFVAFALEESPILAAPRLKHSALSSPGYFVRYSIRRLR